MAKQLKVGETATYNGNLVKAVQSYNCDNPCVGCLFKKMFICEQVRNTIGECDKLYRTDGVDIIYVKI